MMATWQEISDIKLVGSARNAMAATVNAMLCLSSFKPLETAKIRVLKGFFTQEKPVCKNSFQVN
jgi:hypothetical protein